MRSVSRQQRIAFTFRARLARGKQDKRENKQEWFHVTTSEEQAPYTVSPKPTGTWTSSRYLQDSVANCIGRTVNLTVSYHSPVPDVVARTGTDRGIL